MAQVAENSIAMASTGLKAMGIGKKNVQVCGPRGIATTNGLGIGILPGYQTDSNNFGRIGPA